MTKSSRNSNHRAVLAALPKIELHRHLEGSLRLSTLREIALEYRIDLPAQSLEELRPYVQVTNDEPNFSTSSASSTPCAVFIVPRKSSAVSRWR